MFKEPQFDHDLYRKWLEKGNQEPGKAGPSHYITISREFGCEAYQAAMRICSMINEEKDEPEWLIFSHPILENLISTRELGAELIDEVSEKRYKFVDWFRDGLVPDHFKSTPSKIFQRMQNLIMNLVEKGNCIIVGGGAQIITSELDPYKFNALHVRLVSSPAQRLQRVMDRFGLNKGDAQELLKEKQHARDKFIEDFTGKNAQDQLLYHLILNNDKLTPDRIAKTILSLYREMRKGIGA